MKLPNITGSNLLRRKVELPADLQGKINLLCIAFYQWQQMEVDSWAPLSQELEQTQPDFHFYELPTIQRRNVLAQAFINEGMRSGIPDPATRERTITLYIDKQAFQHALSMPDEDHIYILLVDRAGNVLWQARGENTQENSASLRQAIAEFHLQTQSAG